MRFGNRPPRYREVRAIRRYAWWPRQLEFKGRWIWFEHYWEIQEYELRFGFLGIGDWAAWNHVCYAPYEAYVTHGNVKEISLPYGSEDEIRALEDGTIFDVMKRKKTKEAAAEREFDRRLEETLDDYEKSFRRRYGIQHHEPPGPTE
jgi:hypothetical protein